MLSLKCHILRHVHTACDPEASDSSILERRANQHNYMYVCKICKGHPRPASATSSSPSRFNEDSNDASWDGSYENLNLSGGIGFDGTENGGFGPGGRMGIGKGKPMAALSGKRGRRGFAMAGRPRVGSNGSPTGWKGGPNKPGGVGMKKRVGEVRRRGRQPKIRGMVGLQVTFWNSASFCHHISLVHIYITSVLILKFELILLRF